jgi:hypothetical protein
MSNAAPLAAMLKETASIGSAFSGKLPILIRAMKVFDLGTRLWQFLLVRRMDNNDTKIGRLFLIFVRKNIFLAFAFNYQSTVPASLHRLTHLWIGRVLRFTYLFCSHLFAFLDTVPVGVPSPFRISSVVPPKIHS